MPDDPIGHQPEVALSAPGIAAPGLAAPDAPPLPELPQRGRRFSIGDIFLGDEGLRAGWSLLAYFAVLWGVMALAGLIAHVVDKRTPQRPTAAAPSGPPAGHAASAPAAASTGSTQVIAPKTALLDEGVIFLCVAIATWIMAKIEHRPLSAFGLTLRSCALSYFLAGLGWGVGLLSLLVLGLRALGLLVFDGRLLFGASALRYAAIWAAGFLMVGLLEEYFFRGYLQFTLARGLSGIYGWLRLPARDTLGFWSAAVLLSFGFGFTHRSNPGESPIGLLSAGLIGVVFCLSLWRTGSLWWALGFHAAWDWAQSFFYGVADSGEMVQGRLFATHPVGRLILSGGLTGPEGSILIVPTVALAAAAILLTLRGRRVGDEPAGALPHPPQPRAE